MTKQLISFENYTEQISKIEIDKLPALLQNGHFFFLEAKTYYTSDPTIRETIDMYLNRLNTYHSKNESPIEELSLLEVDFLNRFVAMHNHVLNTTKLKDYILELQLAISEKQITKSSASAKHINQIQQKLIKLYNDEFLTEQVKIVINKKWLSKLLKTINPNISGLVETDGTTTIKQPVKTSQNKSSTLFSSMNAVSSINESNTFRLKGALGFLLGDIERFELAITIEGDQGGGKTRFTYQLADAFAELGHRLAIFSLEIGRQSDLINRMKSDYLQPKHQHQIFIADQLPEGYKTIEDAANHFDVIIIDSWNKTGLPSGDFDKLRKSNPNTIFIVIFQRTTQKTIRGGTAPLFDAGINIEVVKADDSFKNNYAITSKNRYGITGMKYNIHSKDIIEA